ncbi:MAG: hypothetical protein KDJ29_20135 [Hyphomicrobiales bacterium]|nr:hypothetical protein [Hyphomicrobiales bacterium]
MFSGIVIIPASSVHAPFPAQSLLRGLSSLVPATVQGLLADVAIAAPSGIADLERIADHAGCALLEADTVAEALAGALAGARKPDVLMLALGYSPVSGFHEELDGLLRAGVRHCMMRQEPVTFMQRLFPALAPTAMVTAPREEMLRLAVSGRNAANLGQLARRLARVRVLSNRAIRLED